MVASTSNLLGIGIYTPEEAARYARINHRTMNRWLFDAPDGDKPVIKRQLEGQEKLVTFLDFIQALSVRAVRLCDKRLPLQRIRRGLETAREKHNVDYPLAYRHKIFLFGPKDSPDKCELIISKPDESDPTIEQYVQLTGKKSGNFMIAKVAELFIQEVSFDGPGGLASEYTPLKKDSRSIVLNPHRHFGDPLVSSCGYTAESLWEAYKNEGGVDEAAKAYGVERDDVLLACSYYDYLLGTESA